MPPIDDAPVKLTDTPTRVPKKLRRLKQRVALVSAMLAVLVAAGAAIGAAVVASGWYDISVTSQHTQPVYRLLEVIGRRSIVLRARDVEVPELAVPAMVQRGAACFRDKCLQCHGGPGVAQGEIGLSMQPLPGPLVDAAARWHAKELYWITRHGIKMSGMPAWQYRLSEDDLWAVVAFLQVLPGHTAKDFREQVMQAPGQCRREGSDAVSAHPVTWRPDAARGRLALHQHACTACHHIPGIAGADVQVGPPLGGLARRQLIAGRLANTEANMVRWIRDPASVDAETAMPALGVSEADARDMAAYLETLR